MTYRGNNGLRYSTTSRVWQFFAYASLLMLYCLGLPNIAHSQESSRQNDSLPATSDSAQPTLLRAAILSSAKHPKPNTSQGLYISILQKAGWTAQAISADEVRDGGLRDFDVFIIGGGSGTKFNASLGPEGGQQVEAFVKSGGGVLASCAGGYSFVLGHNEALRYIEIAQARCIDTQAGRWARGKGVVEVQPNHPAASKIKMFYANGPLWEIVQTDSSATTFALASFESDIHPENDPGGIMPGTPAILGGTFGDGRFVLFSGHPEFKKNLGSNGLIVDAAHWVIQGKLKENEQVDWPTVFPSFSK